jgi:DNA topoisomerase-1
MSKSISKPTFNKYLLQEKAFRKLGFDPDKTMIVAYNLYNAGYITYPDTESTFLPKFMIDSICKYIGETYGEEFFKCNAYSNNTTATDIENGHMAIVSVSSKMKNIVINIEKNITNDEMDLYKLIWKRSIRSQM